MYWSYPTFYGFKNALSMYDFKTLFNIKIMLFYGENIVQKFFYVIKGKFNLFLNGFFWSCATSMTSMYEFGVECFIKSCFKYFP